MKMTALVQVTDEKKSTIKYITINEVIDSSHWNIVLAALKKRYKNKKFKLVILTGYNVERFTATEATFDPILD